MTHRLEDSEDPHGQRDRETIDHQLLVTVDDVDPSGRPMSGRSPQDLGAH